MKEKKLPKCPVCKTELIVHDPVGLYRFRCPKGESEGDFKHSYFM